MAVREERDGGNRWYLHPLADGSRTERYMSVTTVIDLGIPKPALKAWAAKLAAEYAVANRDIVGLMIERGDEDAAVDLIKNAHTRYRERAALRGSQIHEAIEAYVLNRPYPGVPEPARESYEQFLRFLEAYKPDVEQAEAAIFNRSRRIAGTGDSVMVFDHPVLLGHRFIEPAPGAKTVRLLVDYKTGKAGRRKNIWPETALQLSAYAHGEFFEGPEHSEHPMGGVRGCTCGDCLNQQGGYAAAAFLNGLAGAEHEPPPMIDGAIAIHIHPDHGLLPEVYPVDCREQTYRHFLHAYETARWAEIVSKDVIDPPIENPSAPTEPPPVEEFVVEHPCPECGNESFPVKSDKDRAPKWRCSNPDCTGGKDDQPWASWATNPWKKGGEIEKAAEKRAREQGEQVSDLQKALEESVEQARATKEAKAKEEEQPAQTEMLPPSDDTVVQMKPRQQRRRASE